MCQPPPACRAESTAARSSPRRTTAVGMPWAARRSRPGSARVGRDAKLAASTQTTETSASRGKREQHAGERRGIESSPSRSSSSPLAAQRMVAGEEPREAVGASGSAAASALDGAVEIGCAERTGTTARAAPGRDERRSAPARRHAPAGSNRRPAPPRRSSSREALRPRRPDRSRGARRRRREPCPRAPSPSAARGVRSSASARDAATRPARTRAPSGSRSRRHAGGAAGGRRRPTRPASQKSPSSAVEPRPHDERRALERDAAVSRSTRPRRSPTTTFGLVIA